MADRQIMPSIDFADIQGLFTKQNPEMLQANQLRECQNVDFFREYGSVAKLRGNSLVLNDVYSESGNVKPISWGAFYKTQNLSGAIDRQVLIGAGTTIRKINSDGTTTSLLTGEPSGLYRTADQLDRFMFITSQDPYDVGTRGQMSKYNGTRIVQWGLFAPGEQETEEESFDDSTIFTASNCTLADSSLPAYKGEATAMTKGTASTSCYMEDLNRTPFSANNVIEDRVRMHFFIERTDYRKLATSGRCISVYFGSDSTLGNNYYRFDFQIGRVVEGWNTLTFDFSVFPTGDFGTTVGTPDDANLCSIRFEIVTNNASDTPVVYWDNLVLLDQGAPIPDFSGTGTVFVQDATSIWNYRVTFVDDAGFESNAGPTSIDADNTTGSTDYASILLTQVPVSTNPAVVKRNIYRTVASGSTFLFLDSINDNVTTTYTDTTSDTSLGTATPPTLGQDIFDNSPPPNGGIMCIWKRTAFVAGDPLNPTLLQFSRFDFPEAFPSNNQIEFDERVTGLMKTYLGVVVCTETAYWRIIGDNPDYTVDKVINGFGCIGPRAIGTARENGWIIDRDGMRLYDLRETSKISEVIRDRVDAFYKGDLELTHSCHSRKNNSILWFTKDSDGVYSDIYNYQYIIDDVTKGVFSQIVPNPATQNIQHVWEIEDANGDNKLYASTSGGQVYELMADDSFDWLNETGQRRAIEMRLRTPFIRLGFTPDAAQSEGTTGRVTPRLIELRIKEMNQAAHTWTLTVETSDSSDENATVRDSQDITFAFGAGQSLLRIPPQDLTPGEFVRFTLVNNETGKDLILTGMKVWYHVRPGQFVVTSTQVGAAGQN